MSDQASEGWTPTYARSEMTVTAWVLPADGEIIGEHGNDLVIATPDGIGVHKPVAQEIARTGRDGRLGCTLKLGPNAYGVPVQVRMKGDTPR